MNTLSRSLLGPTRCQSRWCLCLMPSVIVSLILYPISGAIIRMPSPQHLRLPTSNLFSKDTNLMHQSQILFFHSVENIHRNSNFFFFYRNKKVGWGCGSVAASLPRMVKALGSIPRAVPWMDTQSMNSHQVGESGGERLLYFSKYFLSILISCQSNAI